MWLLVDIIRQRIRRKNEERRRDESKSVQNKQQRQERIEKSLHLIQRLRLSKTPPITTPTNYHTVNTRYVTEPVLSPSDPNYHQFNKIFEAFKVII